MLTDKCYRVKDLRPKRLESVSKDTSSNIQVVVYNYITRSAFQKV